MTDPRWTVGGLIAFLTPAAAIAYETPAASRPHPTPAVAPQFADVYDLLYLAPRRQILLRLHVRAGGRPYPERWERALDALFADLDRDGDGGLSPTECGRVLPA